MKTKCAALLVMMLAGVTSARAAEQSPGAVIRSVQIVEEAGVTHVTIEAEGPLPLPLSDTLNDPPRIYFDLAGVTQKVGATTVPQRGGVVSRVRVGLHSSSPRVTRVVLDLTRRENYRVDLDERQAGRIRILVGSDAAIHPAPSTATAAPSPAVRVPAITQPVAPPRIVEMPAPPASISQPETPAASPADTPAPPTVPPPTVPTPAVPSPPMPPPPPARNPVLSPEPLRPVLPARDVENYRKQVFAELARMEALRAVIERIDAAQNHPSDDLASTATQFTEVRRKLEAVKPAAVLAPTHDLLMTSCTFAAMASRLAFDAAADSNPDTRQRAASAAAGSLMLFNRACVDLGCGRTPR